MEKASKLSPDYHKGWNKQHETLQVTWPWIDSVRTLRLSAGYYLLSHKFKFEFKKSNSVF